MPQDLSAVSWPVRTERLTFRPATADDVEAAWEFRRLPEVQEWMKTLVVQLDGVLIGDLMLAVGDAWSQAEVRARASGVQAEIGWCLSPDHQGHGYATEAVRELLRICFEELGLRRVVAMCFADNVPSWRLMERLGMRREEYAVRDSLHRSGEWLDGMTYALLAEEWRSRRQR
jgi:RimJ/RimL family protein N-acetyltransferase